MGLFEVVNRTRFELKSGRLLIADPYHLGYPEEVNEQIDAAKEQTTVQNPIVYLTGGALFWSQTDTIFRVYQKGVAVEIIDEREDKRRKGRVLEVPVDVCLLLVGDADVFQGDPDQEIRTESGLYLCEYRPSWKRVFVNKIKS